MIKPFEWLVDQRDIQRLGGRCAKYPSSVVVKWLIKKYVVNPVVLDVTYGRGRFYYSWRPKYLVGVDPVKRDWLVTPNEFIKKPIQEAIEDVIKIRKGFNVIVLDPPCWKPRVRYTRRSEYMYLVGTLEEIIKTTIYLCKVLNVKYLLMHHTELLDLPKVEVIRFRYVARYLNNPNLRTTYFVLYKVQ